MRYHVRHQTTYRYSEPVLVSLNQICLTPRDTATQRVIRHAVATTPAPRARVSWMDYFGNQQIQCAFGEPHAELIVVADSEVEAGEPQRENSASSWDAAAAAVRTHADPPTLDALQYCFDSPLIRRSADLRTYAEARFPPRRPAVDALAELAVRIKADFVYDPTATTLQTTVEEAFARRRGVCQDFTQVMIGALRSLGMAARYVSGYVRTRPPPGRPRLVGADASHCWVSAFVPGPGWVDVDPTNGCLVGEDHITVAWGRDYQDVTPVKGVILGGGAQSIAVAVDVVPVGEAE